MTVEAYSSLPLAAGSAVLARAGRLVWWGTSVYMRAPLRNTALAALVTLSAMAGSNALYKQSHRHPSPLFGSFDSAPAAETKTAAVKPAAKPLHLAPQPTDSDTTGTVVPVTSSKPGNADVLDVQRKLADLNLFDGKADGIYGPRTARAIKAFEQSIGRTPKGQLTPEIVALIKSASDAPAAVPSPTLSVEAPPAEQIVAETPEPAPIQAKVVAPLALTAEAAPLPAPAPLQAISAAEGESQQAKSLLSNPVADENIELTTAAVDPTPAVPAAAIALPPAPDAGPAPASPAAVATRTVQTIAVRAAVAAPAATQAMPAALPPIPAGDPSTDPRTVAAIQRGLNSLGFLHGEVDGVAGEATSKAIRNFEVYYNYDVTGRISTELVKLLVQNGAVI